MKLKRKCWYPNVFRPFFETTSLSLCLMSFKCYPDNRNVKSLEAITAHFECRIKGSKSLCKTSGTFLFFCFFAGRMEHETWLKTKKEKKVVTDDCQAFDFIVTRQKFAYICISPRLFLCCFVNFSLMEKPAETAVVRLPLFLLFEHFQFANRAESTKEEDDEKRMDGAVLVSHSSLPLNPIHFHNAFH